MSRVQNIRGVEENNRQSQNRHLKAENDQWQS